MFLRVLTLLSTMVLLQETAEATGSLSNQCQEKCGEIEIPQPFGMAQGCYRPGFRLRCNTTANTNHTSRLFLDGSDEASRVEVTRITSDPPQVSVNYHPVAFLNASSPYRSTTWRALENTPFSFDADYNSLIAVGCDVMAYVRVFTSPSSNPTIISSCYISCEGVEPNKSEPCLGILCCMMDLPTGFSSYEIQLVRQNQTRMWNKTSSWACIGTPNEGFTGSDAFLSDAAKLRPASAVLDWSIIDKRTCEAAQKEKNTYACGPNSHCVDNGEGSLGGYHCQCDSDHIGNPYDKLQGCKATRIRISPSPNCPRNCGNLSIPFPFGIGDGCFRQIGFNLSCDDSGRQTMLDFQGSNLNITRISLDEGTLEGSKGWSDWVDDYSDKLTITNLHQIFLTKGLGSELPVFEWVIDSLPCEAAARNSSTYACSSIHSECYRARITGRKDYGYRCRCEKGYEGNPYVLDGCKGPSSTLQVKKIIHYSYSN